MGNLFQTGENKILPDSLACITRVHNEEKLLEEFFRHHRALGRISFLVIDDRSTDSTPEILDRQPDVTVFRPQEDSHYRDHKKVWVQELLDSYCANRWALCLDADEHLIYRDAEHRDIQELIARLERLEADSFPAIMLDMYADRPLAEHHYSGGSLAEAFPYFDDPSTYRVMYKRRSRLFHASGGMRFRLFAKTRRKIIPPGFPFRFNIRRGKFVLFLKRKLDQAARFVSDRIVGTPGYRPNTLKVPLIFWRQGMKWDEHNIAGVRRQSTETGALLHFKMAKGISGIEYLADRNQHAGDSLYSRWILSTGDLGEINPVCSVSRKYTGTGIVFKGNAQRRRMSLLTEYRKILKYTALRRLPGERGQVYDRKLKTMTRVVRFDGAIRRSAGLTSVDLGANVGEYALKMAETAKRVVAFEPDPWAIAALRSNVAGHDRVEIIEAAAGLVEGTAILHRHHRFDEDPAFYSLSSSVVAEKVNMAEEKAVVVRQIDFVRWLEDLDEDIGIIKMDIEGAEVDLLEALFGRPDLLKRIGHIFAETHADRIPGQEIRVKALCERARRMKRPYINLYWH